MYLIFCNEQNVQRFLHFELLIKYLFKFENKSRTFGQLYFTFFIITQNCEISNIEEMTLSDYIIRKAV